MYIENMVHELNTTSWPRKTWVLKFIKNRKICRKIFSNEYASIKMQQNHKRIPGNEIIDEIAKSAICLATKLVQEIS